MLKQSINKLIYHNIGYLHNLQNIICYKSWNVILLSVITAVDVHTLVIQYGLAPNSPPLYSLLCFDWLNNQAELGL